MGLFYFWMAVDEFSDQSQSYYQQYSYCQAIKQVRQVKQNTVSILAPFELFNINDDSSNNKLDANKGKHSPVDSILPTRFSLALVSAYSFMYNLLGTYRSVEVVKGESPQAQNLQRVKQRNHNQLAHVACVGPGDFIHTVDKLA